MLQEANNFYIGSNVVSRLYMGETLVWPFPSGNITYSNGNIISDWGDSNTSGIVSDVNVNHTFQ